MSGKRGMSRGPEYAERARWIQQMFYDGEVTARMIQDRYQITRQCAHKWIDRIGYDLPVYEIGTGPGTGRPKVYGLLKD